MRAGLLSTEREVVRDAEVVFPSRRQNPTHRYGEGGRNPAVSKNPCRYVRTAPGPGRSPCHPAVVAGPLRKGAGRNRWAFFELKKDAAAGADGMTWRMYDKAAETAKWLGKVVAGKFPAMSHLHETRGDRHCTGRPRRRCARRPASVRSEVVGLAGCH